LVVLLLREADDDKTGHSPLGLDIYTAQATQVTSAKWLYATKLKCGMRVRFRISAQGGKHQQPARCQGRQMSNERDEGGGNRQCRQGGGWGREPRVPRATDSPAMTRGDAPPLDQDASSQVWAKAKQPQLLQPCAPARTPLRTTIDDSKLLQYIT
jgi:hypothetical protein